jgi:hypothetical protein
MKFTIDRRMPISSGHKLADYEQARDDRNLPPSRRNTTVRFCAPAARHVLEGPGNPA